MNFCPFFHFSAIPTLLKKIYFLILLRWENNNFVNNNKPTIFDSRFKKKKAKKSSSFFVFWMRRLNKKNSCQKKIKEKKKIKIVRKWDDVIVKRVRKMWLSGIQLLNKNEMCLCDLIEAHNRILDFWFIRGFHWKSRKNSDNSKKLWNIVQTGS